MLQATGHIGIGSCEQCKGPMCVSGQKVRCEHCGWIAEGHPLTRDRPLVRRRRP